MGNYLESRSDTASKPRLLFLSTKLDRLAGHRLRRRRVDEFHRLDRRPTLASSRSTRPHLRPWQQGNELGTIEDLWPCPSTSELILFFISPPPRVPESPSSCLSLTNWRCYQKLWVDSFFLSWQLKTTSALQHWAINPHEGIDHSITSNPM